MPAKPSALVDTRVIYSGDNLDQLRKLPEGCIDLIYIEIRPLAVREILEQEVSPPVK